MGRVALLLGGLALGWSGSASAASPAKLLPAAEPAMQVYLAREAESGCEPNCQEWIAAQGRIEAGSVARFSKVLRQLGNRKVPVLIDSSGGRVNEALEIGRLARAKGLDVVVSRTVFISCATADADCRRRAGAAKARLGVPIADLSMCASSCAFILAAGKRRLVGPAAFVGVHQVRSFYVYARLVRTYRFTPSGREVVSERRVTERVVETRTPERTYDQIRRYFTEMGIGEAIMPLILSTPGDRLHWMTRSELETTRLVTDWMDGGQAPAGPAVPGPAPVAAPALDGVPGAPTADASGAAVPETPRK
jgi:hypothetical protein